MAAVTFPAAKQFCCPWPALISSAAEVRRLSWLSGWLHIKEMYLQTATYPGTNGTQCY